MMLELGAGINFNIASLTFNKLRMLVYYSEVHANNHS